MLHLTADKGGASTGKTQVPSISEALSNARAARDKGWVREPLSLFLLFISFYAAKFPIRRL